MGVERRLAYGHGERAASWGPSSMGRLVMRTWAHQEQEEFNAILPPTESESSEHRFAERRELESGGADVYAVAGSAEMPKVVADGTMLSKVRETK